MVDWTPYQQGYDHQRRLFTKKQSAASLADALAAELRLNRRSLVIEGKNGEYHLFNAYAGMYYMPAPNSTGWQDEFDRHQRLIRKVMQS